MPGPPAPFKPSTFDEHIRELELKISQEELLIKQQEAKRSKSNSPLMVAVIGAILVGLVNIYASNVSSRNAELSAKSAEHLAQIATETSSQQQLVAAENTDILEVVKLSKPDDVHSGLCHLLQFNMIKTPSTNQMLNDYLNKHQGCEEKPPTAQWLSKAQSIPGCGTSGCYASAEVCGDIPVGMTATGNVRNFTDSFSGAWGDWQGAATVSSSQVCRIFQQHSHNVERVVSFQYEVVPLKT